MSNAFRLQCSIPAPPYCNCQRSASAVGSSGLSLPRPPARRYFASCALQSLNNESSQPSVSYQFSSAVGSSTPPQRSHLNLTHRHIQFLSYIACAAAISAAWLFCAAIPTLLSIKRAAESLEKLLDVTREELPDTMAAVRLSGMEISDLTMELSDLGQEITQGVRSSTRIVRVAEERLRRLTTKDPTVSVQEVGVDPAETRAPEPVLARSARGAREGIVKGRAFLQTFASLTGYSKLLLNYFTSRAKA